MGRQVRAWIAGIHPRLAVVGHDLFMVWAAWMLATVARYHFWPDPPPLGAFPPELWIVLGAQGLVLWWTGLYRGLWRFASLPDLFNIVRAAVAGVLAIALGLFLFNRLEGVPRSVLLMYPVLVSVLLGAPRLLYRYWKDSRLDFSQLAPSKRVLVLGAGRAGEALLRDLRLDRSFHLVGLLDDNRSLRGAKLHGVPVLGSLEQLGDIAQETAAEMLLIAMPSASNAQMQRVVEACELTGLPFRTVPRLQDVVAGRLSFNQLKEVAIEDLLGRDPVLLDWTAVRTGLAGKRVLVTGGGGSIGAELCRQVARLGATSLTVLDQTEFNLYRIEQELRRDFPDLLFQPVLGDVCDPAACEYVLGLSRPEVLFHAAAYKHVPLLEVGAREAVRNNVLGTEGMGRAAMRHGVGTFVLISTDKAVNPANVMGASKRAAERVCRALSREAEGRTRFITVRFGNVLDSAGSVVPLFREQIAAGGPVTVTHPEIRRYFMTIPEACQLILQAAVLGEGGEIFVLDMGEPVRIRYLAEQMIRLAGKVPDKDIAIVFTGLRPGEKLFEELFHDHEEYQETRHSKIFLSTPRAPFDGDLDALLRQAHAAVRSYDEARVLELLRQLVPEFKSVAGSGDGDVTSIHRIANQG